MTVISLKTQIFIVRISPFYFLSNLQKCQFFPTLWIGEIWVETNAAFKKKYWYYTLSFGLRERKISYFQFHRFWFSIEFCCMVTKVFILISMKDFPKILVDHKNKEMEVNPSFWREINVLLWKDKAKEWFEGWSLIDVFPV